MSKWIPDWVTHFDIEECEHQSEITISFYNRGDFISGGYGIYPISELEKELSIRDVCQQIKNKPATLDEAFSNQHSRMDVIGQNGNTGEHYKPAKEPAKDEINPDHYKQGDIECIDAIEAALTPDEYRGYLKGNMIKYTWRERLKQQATAIKKAVWYAERLIKHIGV